jgi:NAD(P)-dependent dehydrogenase (short-subunit alcohol dehydrogenase family)
LSEKPVVLITNATQYVGPASVARLVRDGARVVAQDLSFADKAARDAFAAANPTRHHWRR